ncbi:glycosyl transferase [Rhizobium sp. KVB221]|uniref:Glycosyl transferase n=1 Tax=Rhizobium setariae TaxID=2801340 RepID=A0A936YQZ5_9HYPH|nr:glycosyl transferase [Rhizobium setariae]MBL0370755.1 glycosyl transferase [Rhizobium setariae]
MLTVLLECRDNEQELAHTLAVLVAGAVDGLVSDVIVLDHGSQDASAAVADAAGCRFLTQWSLEETLLSARGDWVMLLEAGARPQSGWIEEVSEYAAIAGMPARFSPSRRFRRPFFKRLMARTGALENGYLISKRQAAALARPGMDLDALAKSASCRKLRSELIPAWVIREGR